MSAAQRTALIQHALDLGYMFRQNMAVKHGLPAPSRAMFPDAEPDPPQPLTLRLETTQPLATATATANPAEVSQPPAPPTAPAAPQPTANGWAKNAALIAALAAGTGGLGTAAGYFMRPSESGPTINVQPNDQGLLQWLQENGYHLPDKQPKGKVR